MMAITGKAELTKRVATQTGMSQKEAAAALDAVLEAIREALKAQDDVRLVGFGTFATKMSAERQGVNPQTREKITIAAKRRVSFSAGKELQAAVEA